MAKRHSLVLKSPKPGAYAPWTPGQVYNFVGTTTKGDAPKSFDVLAGDGAPAITNIGAKVNTIDRARRKGFTVVSGYDPIQMDVPIQFEALTDRPGKWWALTPDLDGDIRKLIWMAGRGKLWKTGHAAVGDPPLVTVTTYGTGVNLIPPDFQYNGNPGDIHWVITNAALDRSVDGYIGNRAGKTVRQKATVTLLEWSSVPNSDTENSPAARQKARTGNPNGFRVELTDARHPNVATVTKHATNRGDKAAYNEVLKTTRAHGVNVRSYLKTLPNGTKVYIPDSLFP